MNPNGWLRAWEKLQAYGLLPIAIVCAVVGGVIWVVLPLRLHLSQRRKLIALEMDIQTLREQFEQMRNLEKQKEPSSVKKVAGISHSRKKRKLENESETTLPSLLDRYNILIQKMLDGEDGARKKLQNTLQNTQGVHIIGFANALEYQWDNNNYAEFSDKSRGSCLLIPLDEVGEYFAAFPYAENPYWFFEEHAALKKIFEIHGKNLTASSNFVLKEFAVMRRKEELDVAKISGSPVFIVDKKGLLQIQ